MPDFSIGVAISHQLAAYETTLSQHERILPAHFFCALTKLEDFSDRVALNHLGLPSEVIPLAIAEASRLMALFQRFKLNPRQARHMLRERLGDGGYHRSDEQVHISRSPESRAAFDRAVQLAQEAGAPYVAVQHLLAALLEIQDSSIYHVLAELGINVDELREAAAALPVPYPHSLALVETPTLDQYGVDLTAKARAGDVPPTIGRRDEMMQVIRTLARDSKNNPVLVGEAGVGKTAIVEGIAHRIATGNIHPDFHDKRIIQINAADLVAGATYRGEFEERMKNVIDEASQAADVILFIDEIHMLMGTGKAEGGMNAANILKPALSRGKLKLIGATTHSEYQQHIERDPAMERRFQPIRVDEPSEDETLEILHGIRQRLQDHHGVEIGDEAIAAAIKLSVRYMPSRRLPDKARDLLDEACARARYGTVLSYSPWMDGETRTTSAMVGVEHIQEVVAEKIGVPVGQLTEDEAQRILRMPETLRERVIGQDAAVDAVARIVQRNYANLRSVKRPIGVFLFVGPSGVGKTELAKAMPNFSRPQRISAA